MPAHAEPDRVTWRPWTLLLAGLAVVLAWDASGLDIPLAQWAGDASGFAWRDHALLSEVLHSGARAAGWVVLLAWTAVAVRPFGPFKTLSARERLGWVGSIWAALLVIAVAKGLSRTSCPWDLDVFGGSAQYLSHWMWGRTDGGPGHCFPAGHASTGFAFVAGGFWLLPRYPRLALWWFVWAALAGTVLGVAQQLRGAHFLSHTLWTAWLCWAVGLAAWWRFRPHTK